jgi:hypothetical protein
VLTEFDSPPDSLFMEVGFDTKPGAKEKHYRRYYADELEQVEDKDGDRLIESPFDKANIYRAREAKKQNLLDNLFGSGGDSGPMSVMQTGQFKGIIRCYQEAQKREWDDKIRAGLKTVVDMVKEICVIATGEDQVTRNFNDLVKLLEIDESARVNHIETDRLLNYFTDQIMSVGLSALNVKKLVCDMIFDHQLMSKMNDTVTANVRVYVLNGFNMAKRDIFSKSDPYLKLRCGKKTVDERDNYQLDCDMPDFYQHFDFTVDLPGAPVLEMEVWDYDGFFGDEIIGKTKIDLDDRFYSLSWQSLRTKPIEYRDLFHYQSTVSQGVVKMWIEINDKDSKQAQ